MASWTEDERRTAIAISQGPVGRTLARKEAAGEEAATRVDSAKEKVVGAVDYVTLFIPAVALSVYLGGKTLMDGYAESPQPVSDGLRWGWFGFCLFIAGYVSYYGSAVDLEPYGRAKDLDPSWLQAGVAILAFLLWAYSQGAPLDIVKVHPVLPGLALIAFPAIPALIWKPSEESMRKTAPSKPEGSPS